MFTEIALGSGLGSSSFAVCLAACFLHWKRLQNGEQRMDFNPEELKLITDFTESCKSIVFHNNYPSIHAEISVFGNIGKYRIAVNRNLSREFINLETEIKIFIIATKFDRDWEERMEAVTTLLSILSDSDSFENILDEMATTIYDRISYINNIANINDRNILENAYNALQKTLRRIKQY